MKGMEDGLRVLRNGLPDDILTEHWDETIASFLPLGIAHLFFFDGEQIKDLAYGGHAAEIIGTGINSLLGVDLLERLSADLRVFERGVRKEQDQRDQEPVRQQIVQAEGEVAQIDRELERIALTEGAKVNEASRAAKALRDIEERFQSAGGDLCLRRAELEAARADLERRKAQAEEELRELIPGPIPLALVTELLATVAEQARHETRIRHARILDAALESATRL
jgi:DNA sulfur modification protein DndD